MKVLISGVSGFVGRHFAQRLCAEHEVTGVDFYMPATDYWKGTVHRVRDDFRRFMRIHAPTLFDLIIHCAATVGGRLKIDGDPLAVATNLAIDADFFNWIACSKNKEQRIVYFSSSAIYPPELQTRKVHCQLSEGMVSPLSSRFSLPDQTYGFSKLAGELLAHKAVKDYGSQVVIYRPFGGYGADQSLDYPFPSIIKRVLAKENPLTVWGSGDQVRDFIHINDIVEGVLSTYDKMPAGKALNLGTGIGVSFRELALKARMMAGYEAPIVNDASKPEGVFYRVSDPYLMEQLFKPKISLEQGIRQALPAATVLTVLDA